MRRILLSILLLISTASYASQTVEDSSMIEEVLTYLQANPDAKNIRFFIEENGELESVHKFFLDQLRPGLAGFFHDDFATNPNAFPPIASTYFHQDSGMVYLELVHGTHYHFYPFVLNSFTDQVPSEFTVKFQDNGWDCPALSAIEFPDSANLAHIAFCNN